VKKGDNDENDKQPTLTAMQALSYWRVIPQNVDDTKQETKDNECGETTRYVLT
jgi:hypothetical protein